MSTVLKYVRKIFIITAVDALVVAFICYRDGYFNMAGFGKGMMYMGLTMFFFGIFALTGAGSMTRGDFQQQYVRSAGGASFDKMSKEFMGPSNKKASSTIALFITSVVCVAIGYIIGLF